MTHTRRPFPARYPGRCCCGARFDRGARIFWDSSARIATGCPSCRSPRARKGTWTDVDGLAVRIDTHPQTGAPVVVVLTVPGEGLEVEAYRLRDGVWHLHSGMVFARPLASKRIAAIVAKAAA